MNPEEVWIDYSPPWAPHVKGRYTERTVDPETRQPTEQRYVVKCEKCGAQWGPTTCLSGMVRQHIVNFAIAHPHRDPLIDPFPGRR